MHFGGHTKVQKKLKVVIPENLDYTMAFDSLFQQASTEYTLNRVKTIEMGSLYELEYLISFREETNEKKFIDDLRCRNGNLNVSLQMAVQAAEF